MSWKHRFLGQGPKRAAGEGGGRAAKVWFFFFLASVFFSIAAPGATEDLPGAGSRAELPRLWVQLCDGTGLEPASRHEIQRQVSSIYASAGVELLWSDECRAAPIRSAHVARVYILEMIPAGLLSQFPHYQRKNSMMGYTPTDPGGTPGAIIWVSRRSVAAAASDLGAIPLPPPLLCRALARVITHELAHRFIQKEHVRQGILRATMDRGDLTDSHPRNLFFTESQVRHLQSIAVSGDVRPATSTIE